MTGTPAPPPPPSPPPTAEHPLLNSPQSRPATAAAAESPLYTVDDAIEAAGMGPFQYVVLLLTGLCWTAESMEMLLLSFIKAPLQCEWHISDEQAALITTCVAVGMLLGATAWGVLADRLGRRFAFIASTLFVSLLGLASAASLSYPMMLLTRGLVGFGIGGVPVSFSVLMEVLPSAQRGAWGMSLALFWAVGAIFEAAVAMAVLPHYGWRALVVASTLPLFLVLALSFWLPESPRWLVAHARVDKAAAVLRRIASINSRTLPHGQLVVAVPVDPAQQQQQQPAAAAAGGGEREDAPAALPADYIPPEPPAGANTSTTAALNKNNNNHDHHRPSSGLPAAPAPAARSYDAEAPLASGGDSPAASPPARSNFAAVVRPGTRALAFHIAVIWFVSGFVYYGVVMLQPEFIAAENAGHRCTYAQRECAAHATQPACAGEGICTWKGSESSACVPTGTAHHDAPAVRAAATAAAEPATAAATAAPVAQPPRKSKAEARDPACARQLTRSDFMSTLWASVGELPGVIAASVLVNVIGRRPLLGYFCVASVAGFILLIWCLGRMAETVVFFTVRGATSGLFQTVYLYTNEVYPAVVRARAMGVASSVARCGLIITPFIAQYLSNISGTVALGVYAGVSFTALVSTVLLPIETTMRPLVDTMDQLVEQLRFGDDAQRGGVTTFASDPAVPGVVKFFRWNAKLDGMASV